MAAPWRSTCRQRARVAAAAAAEASTGSSAGRGGGLQLCLAGGRRLGAGTCSLSSLQPRGAPPSRARAGPTTRAGSHVHPFTFRLRRTLAVPDHSTPAPSRHPLPRPAAPQAWISNTRGATVGDHRRKSRRPMEARRTSIGPSCTPQGGYASTRFERSDPCPVRAPSGRGRSCPIPRTLRCWRFCGRAARARAAAGRAAGPRASGSVWSERGAW